MIKSDYKFSPDQKVRIKIMEAGTSTMAEATIIYCNEYTDGYFFGCSATFSES